MSVMRNKRLLNEMKMFRQSPPFGISCWKKDGEDAKFESQIYGGAGTPYEKGVFKLEIQIPERYPFVPPVINFITKIYHPNVDNEGRICLDTLKMPPKGAWKPIMNLLTVLTSVQLLMAEPGPDDPLMTDIANEYKYNRPAYIKHAKEYTQKYAMEKQISLSPNDYDENNGKRKLKDTESGTVQKKKSCIMGDVTNLT